MGLRWNDVVLSKALVHLYVKCGVDSKGLPDLMGCRGHGTQIHDEISELGWLHISMVMGYALGIMWYCVKGAMGRPLGMLSIGML